MEPEITLLAVFLLSAGINIIRTGQYQLGLSGRISMSAMLIVTSIAHFAFTKGMVLMLPDWIPLHKELVYATGVVELMAAAGLQIKKYRVQTGYALILFMFLLLPSNIYAAMHHVDIKTAGFQGNGPEYLLVRIPIQIVFVIWIYLSSVFSRDNHISRKKLPVNKAMYQIL